MRDDKAVIGMGVGSALVAGAAANHLAMGAVGATGQISKSLATLAAAGDQGWDVDGNFVCSKFVFNFKTGQVFDSLSTYHVRDIDNVYAEGTSIVVIRGSAYSRVPVGVPERVSTILQVIREMQAGMVFRPEPGRRLSTAGSRGSSLGIGTAIRFAWHAAVLGLVLTFLTALFIGPPIRMFVFELWFFALMFGFVGLKLLRRGRLPKWASAYRPSKVRRLVGFACLSISVLLLYGVRSNVESFNYYKGQPPISVMEACSSYTYTGMISETLQPFKWWCGSMEAEVLKGRDAAFKKWLKTH